MREALVRATGRRESADDPALASLVADAPEVRKVLRHRPARASPRWSLTAWRLSGHRGRRPQRLGPRAPLHPGGALSAARPRRRRTRHAPSSSAWPPRAACRISVIPLPLADATGNALGARCAAARRRSATVAMRCWSGAADAGADRRSAAVDPLHGTSRAKAGAVRWRPASMARSISWRRRRRPRSRSSRADARVRSTACAT